MLDPRALFATLLNWRWKGATASILLANCAIFAIQRKRRLRKHLTSPAVRSRFPSHPGPRVAPSDKGGLAADSNDSRLPKCDHLARTSRLRSLLRLCSSYRPGFRRPNGRWSIRCELESVDRFANSGLPRPKCWFYCPPSRRSSSRDSGRF